MKEEVIKERAKRHADSVFPCMNEQQFNRTAELSYITGATKQKEIDIERAKKWVRLNFGDTTDVAEMESDIANFMK